MSALTRRRFLAAASSAALIPACVPLAAQEAGAIEEPWSLDGLGGTLARPRRPSPNTPVVLILPGSGPTDRDGNSPGGVRADAYRLLAHALAENGIRSLRYDKRGIGASQGKVVREEDLLFAHYVEDAVAAAADLARRFQGAALILAGHSEGGLIAIRAASAAGAKGIALLASVGRPISALLREQLSAAPMPSELRREALSILERLIAGERVANVPPLLAPIFQPCTPAATCRSRPRTSTRSPKRVPTPASYVSRKPITC